MTEALITYGRVLARSERYGESLATFRHVIELSDRAGLLNRAAEAALAAFREIGVNLLASEQGKLVSGRRLGQDKRSMEHEVIKLALEQAKGKVSQAARSLGISHQSLIYMLRTRHKDLLKDRTPVRHRKRR